MKIATLVASPAGKRANLVQPGQNLAQNLSGSPRASAVPGVRRPSTCPLLGPLRFGWGVLAHHPITPARAALPHEGGAKVRTKGGCGPTPPVACPRPL